MRTTALIAAALLAASTAGCASQPSMREADRLALYRAHAGPPVRDFPYLRALRQWTPLGPDALAIWLSPSRAYLLDVASCSDLPWAQAIQITESTGRVSARFDRVIPLGTASSGVPCRIEQIRPLDTHAIRDAERIARADR